jgi:hypothetical protein
MLKLYAWFLPFLISLASFLLAINRDYFVNRKALSIIIAIVILILPAIGYLIIHSFGSISKAVRLLAFRLLKTHVFALFGVVVLGISLLGILLGLTIGFPIQPVLLGSFVLVDVVLFYLLALIWNGNFHIQEPTDFLFRFVDRPEVYIYINGEGRHIPDPQTLFLLGWSFNDVIILDEKVFKAFRIGRPLESVLNARLVRPDDSESEVWMILEGRKKRIEPIILNSIKNLNPKRTIDAIPRSQIAALQEDKPLAAIIFQN